MAESESAGQEAGQLVHLVYKGSGHKRDKRYQWSWQYTIGKLSFLYHIIFPFIKRGEGVGREGEGGMEGERRGRGGTEGGGERRRVTHLAEPCSSPKKRKLDGCVRRAR